MDGFGTPSGSLLRKWTTKIRKAMITTPRIVMTLKKKKKTQINKEIEHSKITILMINLSSTSLLGQ